MRLLATREVKDPNSVGESEQSNQSCLWKGYTQGNQSGLKSTITRFLPTFKSRHECHLSGLEEFLGSCQTGCRAKKLEEKEEGKEKKEKKKKEKKKNKCGKDVDT